MSHTMTILIGEDDKDDQELLREVFIEINRGIELKFVDNGPLVLAALDEMGEALPCLIILDYNMPGMNGADILREIAAIERYKPIPKIVWSTSGADKYQKICRDRGALDYVIKPSNISELDHIARYMLSICKL